MPEHTARRDYGTEPVEKVPKGRLALGTGGGHHESEPEKGQSNAEET
jgi:hypothetical protein